MFLQDQMEASVQSVQNQQIVLHHMSVESHDLSKVALTLNVVPLRIANTAVKAAHQRETSTPPGLTIFSKAIGLFLSDSPPRPPL